ncbi:MAG: amidase, partial [Gammaproteobacteria bacterium]
MTQPWQLNAVDIVDQITGGKLSAVETTKNLLERLKQVNPAINAVVHALPEEALAAARLVDDKIAAGDDPGILAGVPVTIKVNIDQEDLPNTNGLRIQKDHITRYDSPVVTNLRNAGAIIIGRTNTPAFSLRWFTRNS